MANDFVTTSFELVNRLIAVRYKGASKAALREDCLIWVNRNRYAGDRIREEFSNNRMLRSQLDLLDKARERVDCVLFEVGA